MELTPWKDAILENLAGLGEDGRSTADLLRTRKTRIGFRRARINVGAFWTPLGSIYLNTRHYSRATACADPNLLCLLLHEAQHLRQGFFTALSVYGELEAWQLQFNKYHSLTGKTPHPAVAELLSIPLNWDRPALRRARDLMQIVAGTGYRADLLPLYPLGKELLFYMGIHPKL